MKAMNNYFINIVMALSLILLSSCAKTSGASATPATPPSISAISNQSTNGNIPIMGIAFTADEGSGSDEDAQNLTVTATSSNTTVVPNGNINITVNYTADNAADATGGTINITPATGQYGSSIITVTVTDNGTGNLTATTTFTVNAVAWVQGSTTLGFADYSLSRSEYGLNLGGVAADATIYTSTDGGLNWIQRDSNQNYINVASDKTGLKLVAFSDCDTHFGDCYIYRSTNGQTFSAGVYTAQNQSFMGSSGDGTKLVAYGSSGDGGDYSTDSGATWNYKTTGPGALNQLSYMDTNNKIIGINSGDYNKLVYYSSDYGANWISQDPSGSNSCIPIAMAASLESDKIIVSCYNGAVYTTDLSNIASTWTSRTISGTPVIQSLAMSSDGKRIAAGTGSGGTGSGGIYLSYDYGVTWTKSPDIADGYWNNIVMSYDGKQMTATNAATSKTWTLTLP